MSHEPTDPDAGIDADAPIDASDVAVLRRLRRLTERLDPVPDDLVLRSEIAITVAALHAETARLVADAASASTDPSTGTDVEPALVPAMRADAGPAQVSEADSVTFVGSWASLTVLIDRVAADRITLDGWVDPGGATVEIRSRDAVRAVASTAAGRFVVDDLPAGPVWFVIRPDDPGLTPTVTPVLEL